ncbi:MAG TPA: glycosyltransferase [Bacteroidia bacterium]|nr:glycosyltransferase [Bacteroidia bacterium]
MKTESKKVLLFTYYWPPSGGAGVQRWLKFCKYLPEFGVEIKVITVDEAQASYPVLDQSFQKDISPTLEIFKTNSFEPLNIYQKFSGREQVPYAGFANETNENWRHEISRFIRGNFFIPDARRGWNKYAINAAKKLFNEQPFSTIITTSPPHSTQLIGIKFKQKFGVQWIADLRDPWTDIYYYSKMNHTFLAKKIDSDYERKVLEKADKIVVVSEFIKHLFLKKSNKINPDKIFVIPNGYDEEDFKNLEFQKSTEQITIAYNGTLSADYPIQSFIEAFKMVTDKSNNLNIKIRFTGSVAEEVKQLIIKNIPFHCDFIQHVSHKKSVEILMQSDINLLLIPDVANNEGILTGKLFEYLASKNPIICIGPKHGNAAAIIEECKSGYTFDKSELLAISKYIDQLIQQVNNHKSIKIDNHLSEKYSRRNLSKAMAALINN